MRLRRLVLTVLCIGALSSIGLAQEVVYRGGFRACSILSSLATTCAHPIDTAVQHPLAAIKWTADELMPLLATDWATDDGTIWTINLRQGVKWHDGEPFTAADVVFSYNAYANPQVASRWSGKLSEIAGFDDFQAGRADSLSGVVALDDYTIQITLSQADQTWMLLQQPYVVIIPVHLLGDVPPTELSDHPFWSNRVGTGPFMWESYNPGVTITLVKNPDYFLGAPLIDRIEYITYDDASAHLAALESGAIDEFTYETAVLPVTDIDRYDSLPGITVVPANAGLPLKLRVNHNNPVLQDVRVRQAMLYAIDRQGIVDSLYGGTVDVSNSLFTANWALAADLEPYAYNPEKARELLREANYDTSQSFDLVYSYSDTLSIDAITAIQAYLADVGIKVAPRLIDSATQNSMSLDGSWELGYVSNGQGLDPDNASVEVRCGELLALGYCNERVDQLFREGLSSADQAVRAASYQEISRIMNTDAVEIWLWQQVRPLAFSDRFVGPLEHWQEAPVILFNLPFYNEMEKWHQR